MNPSVPPAPSERIMSAALMGGAFVALGLMFFMALRGRDAEAPLEPITLLSGEWAPYSGSRLPDQGAATRVVTAVLRQMGYDPRVEFMPWTRAEEVAERSEFNQGVRGTFPYARVASRERQFYFSDPIMEIEMAIFHHAGRSPGLAELDTLEKLAGLRVLRVAGYRYPEVIEPLLSTGVATVDQKEEAFRRLIHDPQVDAVIEARLVGDALLRERYPQHAEQIAVAPLKFSSPIHLIASKRNPHNLRFIRRFNRTLEAMKREGRLADLEAEVLERIGHQQQVHLQPFEPDGYLMGYLDEKAGESIVLPRGTQAFVEVWGGDYLEPFREAADPARRKVRVRILNGPMQGRELYVDGRAVVLPLSEE